MEQGHGLSCCQEKSPYPPAKCCVDISSQVGTEFPEEASGPISSLDLIQRRWSH